MAEYSPNHIKKSVVGSGHAGKDQVKAMLGILLPGIKINGEDAGDALAVAICHAHSGGAEGRLSEAIDKAGLTGRGAQIIMKGTRT